MTATTESLQERFPFFRTLDRQEMEEFLRFCKSRTVAADDLLWREGDSDNYAAFIVRGRIGIKKRTEFAKDQVIVGTYGSGSVAGELCLLTDNPRSVTAQALEDGELLLLHSGDFEHLMSANPQLALKLLKHIFTTTCGRLSKSYERIASIF